MIFIIEIGGHALHPMPVDINNPEEFRDYIQHEAPKAFHLLILSGYALGSFTGGFVAAYISHDKKILRGVTVGGILMGLGIYNLMTLQHPTWVIVVAFFCFIPFAYLGGRYGKIISTKKQVN